MKKNIWKNITIVSFIVMISGSVGCTDVSRFSGEICHGSKEIYYDTFTAVTECLSPSGSALNKFQKL